MGGCISLGLDFSVFSHPLTGRVQGGDDGTIATWLPGGWAIAIMGHYCVIINHYWPFVYHY